MQRPSTSDLWTRKLLVFCIVDKLRLAELVFDQTKAALMDDTRGQNVGARQEALHNGINDAVARLNLPQPLPDLISSHLSRIQCDTAPPSPDPLFQSLRGLTEEIDNDLAAIPADLQKATDVLLSVARFLPGYSDQEYDAMVFCRENLPKELVTQEVQSWKQDRREYFRRHRESPVQVGDIFWGSRDGQDVIDGVSRYRFLDAFNVGEFEDAQRAIETMAGLATIDGLAGIEGLTAGLLGDSKLGECAFNMFLVSRCRPLASRIRSYLDIALQRLAAAQQPNGSFLAPMVVTDEDGRRSFCPSSYLTALVALGLLRLAREEWQVNVAASALAWLAGEQLIDGSWPMLTPSLSTTQQSGDFLTTLLAAEAFRAYGDPSMHETLDKANEWVWAQQQGDGTWPESGLPFPFAHLLAVEHFSEPFKACSEWTGFPSLARACLHRAYDLSLENNTDAHQIAAVTAYQGLEALLYALLVHPSVGITIYEGKAEQNTIGARAALRAFKDHVESHDNLSSEGLRYVPSLKRLAYFRDQVVHKGHVVPKGELRSMLGDLEKFAVLYASRTLGLKMD